MISESTALVFSVMKCCRGTSVWESWHPVALMKAEGMMCLGTMPTFHSLGYGWPHGSLGSPVVFFSSLMYLWLCEAGQWECYANLSHNSV